MGYQTRVMGTVMDGPGSRRTIYIYCPDVIKTLGFRCPKNCGPQALETALALGKVVAHEIVHAVAPEIPHSSKGLMCERFVPTFLTLRDTRLNPASARVVLTSLKRGTKLRASTPD